MCVCDFVVCLLCVERGKREKKEREKKYGGRLATGQKFLVSAKLYQRALV